MERVPRIGLSLGLLGVFFGFACTTPEPQPPNVLVIVVDTFRADRFGAVGLERSLTPELDRFAVKGLRFSHAQSPRAKTNPAVASLFTGLYPHEHGVRDLISPLRKDVPTLAGELRTAGYQTAAIIGNFVLENRWSGFARGFDTWIEDLPNKDGVPPHNVPSRTATSLTQGALCALGLGEPDASAGPQEPVFDTTAPWFLYLHYMDPHGAYTPPAEYLQAPDESNDVIRTNDFPHNVPADLRSQEGFDAAQVRARYDGEIRYVDAEIGRLLRVLEDAGLLRDTLLVFTSDHGESLGEHDYWFEHGRYAYEATCRVPLFIRGRNVRAGVSHTDITLADLKPTILDYCLGQTESFEDGRVAGHSLRSEFRDPGEENREVFCEKIAGDELARAKQIKAVRFGDWKLVRNYAYRTPRVEGQSDAERELMVLGEELYDLAMDPDERVNLLEDSPEAAPVSRMRSALDRFQTKELEFSELARRLREEREAHRLSDPEREALLRALGY